MKAIKIILILLAVSFVLIQFVRPERNLAEGNSSHEILVAFNVPPDVQQMLRTSCYDCHSNTTRYPWYAEVQPVGWWLNNHIQEARRELNFSEFGAYRLRRQYIKLGQIADQVSEEEMPLPSYTILHADAKLSPERRARLVGWANAMRDSMKAMYPPDSL